MSYLKSFKFLNTTILVIAIVFLAKPAISELTTSGYCANYWINPSNQQTECLDHLSNWRDSEENVDEVNTPVIEAPIGSQFRNRGTGFSDYVTQGIQSQPTQIGSRFRNRQRGW